MYQSRPTATEEPGDYKTVAYTGKDAMAPELWHLLKKKRYLKRCGTKLINISKLGKEQRSRKQTRLKDEPVEETKGKDHDKDGDIDPNDYLAARDKAIKKAMGKDVDESAMTDYTNTYAFSKSPNKIQRWRW